MDPFTGSGRYIPGSASSNGANSFGSSNDVDMVDPFTGASSYRSAAAQQQRVDVQFNAPTTRAVAGGVAKHFPHSKYMTFSVCDASKVLDKIK